MPCGRGRCWSLKPDSCPGLQAANVKEACAAACSNTGRRQSMIMVAEGALWCALQGRLLQEAYAAARSDAGRQGCVRAAHDGARWCALQGRLLQELKLELATADHRAELQAAELQQRLRLSEEAGGAARSDVARLKQEQNEDARMMEVGCWRANLGIAGVRQCEGTCLGTSCRHYPLSLVVCTQHDCCRGTPG